MDTEQTKHQILELWKEEEERLKEREKQRKELKEKPDA